MELISTIQSELLEVTNKLVQLLQSFSSDVFSKKADEQTWSAAEVAEHLLIVNKNLTYVLKTEGEIPDRAPDKKLAVIKDALADRTKKLVAPENVKPTGTKQDQQELINGLQQCSQSLHHIAEEKELQELITQYPHPRLGRLTRLEWMHFIIDHMSRHCLQLEEMRSEVPTNV